MDDPVKEIRHLLADHKMPGRILGIRGQSISIYEVCGLRIRYGLDWSFKMSTCPKCSDLQLPLRQWGGGTVYLLVLSKAKR